MELPAQEEKFVTFGRTEWSNYVRYRPRYPKSLTDLIHQHHIQHNNHFDLAHDVGSGAGIFVPVVADEFGFKHVHVSDPAPDNIESARRILAAYYQQRRPPMLRESPQPNTTPDMDRGPMSKTTLTFSKTSGEEMHTCATSSSVDLVTIMLAAHWMDGPAMMASASKTLAPHGTLAIVIYSAAPWIKHNAVANAAFQTALGTVWSLALKSKRDANVPGTFELERGIRQGRAGLDWIPIDHELWTNIRRIRLRSGDKGEHPLEFPCTQTGHRAQSNVRPDEPYERYEDGQEEAEGWELQVDRDWFRGYLTSMEGPEHVDGMREYKDLMDVLEEEYPGGQRVQVEWAADVILVTRR